MLHAGTWKWLDLRGWNVEYRFRIAGIGGVFSGYGRSRWLWLAVVKAWWNAHTIAHNLLCDHDDSDYGRVEQ
jgi:hypothetical protein